MKAMKRTLVILLIVIFVLPVITYSGIFVTNNAIADEIEKDLLSYSLPSNTEIIDSDSVAGKLMGNGNGMQYMGSILVESSLSEDELKDHYSYGFDYISVEKQSDNNDMQYLITCFDDCRRGKFGEFVSTMLDLDIRGH